MPCVMSPPSCEEPGPHPGETSACDQFESVLEASCGILVTLESIRVQTGAAADEVAKVQSHIHQAIASLRGAIAELRMACSSTGSPAVLGFVAAPPGQERPPEG
jgi:hypothetical protein